MCFVLPDTVRVDGSPHGVVRNGRFAGCTKRDRRYCRTHRFIVEEVPTVESSDSGGQERREAHARCRLIRPTSSCDRFSLRSRATIKRPETSSNLIRYSGNKWLRGPVEWISTHQTYT